MTFHEPNELEAFILGLSPSQEPSEDWATPHFTEEKTEASCVNCHSGFALNNDLSDSL